MIISKPIKKPISIPMQTFPSVIGSNPPDDDPTLLPDATIFSKHQEGDFIDKVFGKNNIISGVDQVLSITTTRPAGTLYQNRTLQCQACIFNDTIFLSSPFVGDNVGLANWAPGDFQSCVTHLIDLAETKTGCSAMVVAINKQDKLELNTILRAFMYLGFELLTPALYNHDSRFILVGYEF
ncbi:hypothetical protein BC941DRAFT_407199 [Chlamydoabsidia padenii]|nr:hypothetical protein BC941DRAFT_407199 [Chlamydoabsidia padenii]